MISLADLELSAWFCEHKISHSGWRIADVDHYMQGNSFFRNSYALEEFEVKVQRTYPEPRNFEEDDEEIEKIAADLLRQRSLIEPNSNMPRKKTIQNPLEDIAEDRSRSAEEDATA